MPNSSEDLDSIGPDLHYDDVIMSAMVSRITNLVIVYSAVYSGTDQRKHQSSASLVFVTGEFPAQRASNAENDVSIMTWLNDRAPDY